MGNMKKRDLVDYDGDGDDMMDDEEDFNDSDDDLELQDDALLSAGEIRARRTWRDTEKYKEMRELHKLINDELYSGFDYNELEEDD